MWSQFWTDPLYDPSAFSNEPVNSKLLGKVKLSGRPKLKRTISLKLMCAVRPSLGAVSSVFMCLTKLQDINPILFTVFTVLYSNFYGLVLAFDISDIVNEKMYNFIDVSIDMYKNLLNALFGLNFVFIILSYVIDGSSLRFTIFETAYIFSPKLFYFVFSCLTLLISLLYTKLFKFKKTVNALTHSVKLANRNEL